MSFDREFSLVITDEIEKLINETLSNGNDNAIYIGAAIYDQKLKPIVMSFSAFGRYVTGDIYELVDKLHKSKLDSYTPIYQSTCKEIGLILINQEIDSKLLNFNSLCQFNIEDLVEQSVKYVQENGKVDEKLCVTIGRHLTDQKMNLLRNKQKYENMYKEFKTNNESKEKERAIEKLNLMVKNMKADDITRLLQENETKMSLQHKREIRRERKMNRLDEQRTIKETPFNNLFKWVDKPTKFSEQSALDYFTELEKNREKTQ